MCHPCTPRYLRQQKKTVSGKSDEFVEKDISIKIIDKDIGLFLRSNWSCPEFIKADMLVGEVTEVTEVDLNSSKMICWSPSISAS